MSANYVNNLDSSGVILRKSEYSFRTRIHDSHNSQIQCIKFSLFHSVNLNFAQVLYHYLLYTYMFSWVSIYFFILFFLFFSLNQTYT